MKKFLLAAVNAKYIHSNPAIYSLRGYAGEGLKPYIELAEYTINQSLQDILADIYTRKPDVIGFSCYIWNWKLIQELLKELPKLLPDTHIWLGGPQVSYDAPTILREFPRLRGIMIGEGEATFKELVTYYVTKEENHREGMQETKSQPQNLSDIAGLCLPTGYTGVRELTDMNTLPFLYEDLEPFTHRIIYYESSRGCPYRCSYCLSSIDKKVRLRDMDIIKRELQFFLEKQVAQVKFVDRTFNCNHNHAMAIWQYIYENDNGITNFHFEISADILREEEILLLNKMRPGLVQLEIGVQSTNPETIQAIDRVMNVDKLEEIVASVHKGENIHQHLDLIAGLPYEDYKSVAESFNRVYAMKPEQLQLGFLKVLKGSPMEGKAKDYGIVYMDVPPYEVLYTKWLSYEDMLRLKQIEEMVEIYYNSNQYTHILPVLEKAFTSPFAMYEALADFYREEGFFVNSPARSYRYQVLLQFAKRQDALHLEAYKELLLYDMYLREKLKSRPDFARNVSEASIKEYIRAFYQQEEQERLYLPDYREYDWKQMSKMTHLEPFFYPVWSVEKMCRMLYDKTGSLEEKDPLYVLFDYKKRSPLTGRARTILTNKLV